MEWKFEAVGPIEADVGVPAGLIDVAPTSNGTLVVVLEPQRGGRRAEELLASAEVSFSNGMLRVWVPERHGRNVDIRCTLAVPEGSALTTRTASADVRCPVRLRSFSGTTASGDTSLGDVDTELSLKSASGDLRCAEVGGRFQVRTASGDVSARRTAGDAHVALASGDLEIDDAGGSVKVETASGDVVIKKASTGRVQVSSASGDVAIGVAKGVGAFLDVTTVSGDSTTTLPFSEEASGAATLEIVCRTVSGDVMIRGAS